MLEYQEWKCTRRGRAPDYFPQTRFLPVSPLSTLSCFMTSSHTLTSLLFFEEPRRLLAVALVQNAFVSVICMIYSLLQASEMPSLTYPV